MPIPPTETARILRQRAEEKLALIDATNTEKLSSEAVRGLFHELQVHNVELEMQNEELRSAIAEKEAIQYLYIDRYEHAPAGYFNLDRDAKIQAVNITGADLLGVERALLINSRFDTFISQETRPTFHDFLDKVFASKTNETCEVAFETERLSTLYVQINAVVTESGGDCKAVVTDITRRIESEKKLAEIAQRLEIFMAAVPVGISFSDDVTCQHITGNPTVLHQFNVSREDNLSASALDHDAPGRNVKFFLDGREITDAELPLQRAVSEKNIILPMELKIVMPNGREWFARASGAPVRDENGNLIGGIAVTEDITEYKLAEAALKLSHESKQMILDVCSIGTFEIDLISGEGEWNSVEYELLGLKPDVSPGNPELFFQFVHPDDVEKLKSDWEIAVETGTLDSEFRIVRPDGQERWLAGKGQFLYADDNNGQVSRFLGVNFDITERKLAEEALREREEQLRTLADSIPNLAWWANGDGYLTWYNRRWYEYTGTTPEEMEGWGWQSVHDPLTLPQVVEQWQKSIATKQPFEMEFPLRGDDGVYRTFLTRSIPVKDSNGNVVRWFGTNTDISALKEVEEQLRESQELLTLAADAGQVGMFDLNMATGDLKWTQQHEVIFGYEPTTTTTTTKRTYRDWADRVHPEDLPKVEDRMRQSLEEMVPFQIEYRLVWPDNSLHWVDVTSKYYFDDSGHCTRLTGAVRDITEQKMAEQSLMESEERFRLLAETMLQGVVHQDAHGTINSMNPAAERILGKSREDFLGNSSVSVEHDTIRENGEIFPGTEHPTMVALRTGQPVRSVIMGVFNPKLQEYRWIGIDAVPVFRSGGDRPSEVYSIFEDITERKQAEKTLRNAHDQLEQRVAERTMELSTAIDHLQREIREKELAEKRLLEETAERLQAIEALREKERLLIQQSRQAAMGEMIGNIAHQWRQPINTLGLYTQRLGAFYGTPSFNKEFLDNSIAKSMEIIKHMSKTIDDFRDYFKPEKEKADFYVIEAIKNTLSLLESNFHNPKITIDFVENDNPVINGYQNEFAQVFLNILNNARDAIIERGVNDPKIIISICSENNCAVITVADNAGGIPDEIISKVFDPYFTTKGPQVGTGIGLFMSKTIIEKNMGGRLTARNTDTGAEFRIEVQLGT